MTGSKESGFKGKKEEERNKGWSLDSCPRKREGKDKEKRKKIVIVFHISDDKRKEFLAKMMNQTMKHCLSSPESHANHLLDESGELESKEIAKECTLTVDDRRQTLLMLLQKITLGV